MSGYRVVETDNYGGDYPNERFACGVTSEEKAEIIASSFNDAFCDRRFWKVVPDGYKLRPGFET